MRSLIPARLIEPASLPESSDTRDLQTCEPQPGDPSFLRLSVAGMCWTCAPPRAVGSFASLDAKCQTVQKPRTQTLEPRSVLENPMQAYAAEKQRRGCCRHQRMCHGSSDRSEIICVTDDTSKLSRKVVVKRVLAWTPVQCKSVPHCRLHAAKTAKTGETGDLPHVILIFLHSTWRFQHLHISAWKSSNHARSPL